LEIAAVIYPQVYFHQLSPDVVSNVKISNAVLLSMSPSALVNKIISTQIQQMMINGVEAKVTQSVTTTHIYEDLLFLSINKGFLPAFHFCSPTNRDF